MANDRSLRESLDSLWRAARHFWPYLAAHKKLIGWSFAALFLEVGLRLLEPWPLKFVFDHVLGKHSAPGAAPLMTIGLAAGAVIAISGFRALASYWHTVGFTQVGNDALARVRTKLYRHVQFLSLSFHNKARTGDLVVRMMGDITMLQDVAVSALMPLIAKMLIMVSMFGLMLWMNWQLGLIALAVMPLFALRTIKLGKRIQEVARKQRQREGAMAAAATESIGSIKIVQAFSLEEQFSSAFSKVSEKSLSDTARGAKLSAALERSVDFLVAIATALILWQGARLALTNKITPGELIVFLAYLRHTYRPLQDFAKYTARLAKASAASERVLDLLEKVPEISDSPTAVAAPPFRGKVQFENVSFSYEKSERPLLAGVHFTALPGQRIALMGPSGAGKTTIASLLLRLYDPTAGRILIDGTDIREFKVDSLRPQIATVLQENVLFGVSIRENIAFGSPNATDEEIKAAADLANATEFIENLPEGFNTVIGERGVTLSQGQRQRIAIARAAIRRSPIVVLDEPTTGLDISNAKMVSDALDRLCEGRTSFVITHDLGQAINADQIVYLEKGRIIEMGTNEELANRGGTYASLWGLRAEPNKSQALSS
jgi:ATP-binding cassette, subfamily B, bacterial